MAVSGRAPPRLRPPDAARRAAQCPARHHGGGRAVLPQLAVRRQGRLYVVAEHLGHDRLLRWLGIAVSHYRFRRGLVRQGYDWAGWPTVRRCSRSARCSPARCARDRTGTELPGVLRRARALGRDPATYIGVPVFPALWLGYRAVRKTRLVAYGDMRFHLPPPATAAGAKAGGSEARRQPSRPGRARTGGPGAGRRCGAGGCHARVTARASCAPLHCHDPAHAPASARRRHRADRLGTVRGRPDPDTRLSRHPRRPRRARRRATSRPKDAPADLQVSGKFTTGSRVEKVGSVEGQSNGRPTGISLPFRASRCKAIRASSTWPTAPSGC